MRVTRVEVRPVPNPRFDLLAYASVTLDDELVVRELHLIRLPDEEDGTPGKVFLAFPSHAHRRRCARPECFKSIRVSDRFCPHCGVEQTLTPPPFTRSDDVHPIRAGLRHHVTGAVVRAYREAVGLPPNAPLPATRGRDPSWCRTSGPDAAPPISAVEDRHP